MASWNLAQLRGGVVKVLYITPCTVRMSSSQCSNSHVLTLDLYRVPAVRPPTLSDLREISASRGLGCTDEQLEDFQECIAHLLSSSYRKIADMPGPSLPVRYPRTPGYRPQPDDNKHNAWYWKCDIPGVGEGKLLGKRVGIKDNIAVSGVPLMNGSKQLQGYVADCDATVVTRILDAGGRIVGKTNCEHHCFSSASFTNCTGPTLNPHNPRHTSGGSSSGNAVAIANGEIDMAVGGDQGGSIRMPSSFCGIVGLKPTWGLVPYTGALGQEFTIDHLGPMAANVKDCALLLEVIAGYDEGRDARQHSNIQVPEYTKQLTGDLSGKTVGLLTEGFPRCQSGVQDLVRTAANSLSATGARVEEVSIPLHSKNLLPTVAIAFDDFYSQINGVLQQVRGFTPLPMIESVRRRCASRPQDYYFGLKVGYMLSGYFKQQRCSFYSQSQNVSRQLTASYDAVLEKHDVLMMPTLPFTAPELPLKGATTTELLQYAAGIHRNTMAFNLTGHPALSINCGTIEGLPVGMMIVGRHFDEATVLQVAYAYERLRDSTGTL